MKLLFDQNLSDRIPLQVADLFPESTHVKSIGLDRGEDASLAQWATRNDYTIVSKDGDFYQRSMVFGHPPKFVWLRVGNCSTALIVDLIREYEAVIREFIEGEIESALILQRIGP